MDKLDFETVKSAALAHADGLLAEWLPSGRYDRHEYVALNPTRADKHAGSFRINVRKGSWADFATDDKGGDLVSLYAYLFGVSQGEACRAVAERLRIGNFPAADKQAFTATKKARNTWTPILPVDERYLASMPTSHHFKDKGRQNAERVSLYRDAQGRVLGAVMRFRHADGSKDDMPCTFCRDQHGNMMWRFRGFDEPRPLYGLEALAAKPDAPVLLVEGEKCKDAAAACADLSDYVAVSWAGGSNAWKKTDWQPLAGRRVVCWPDCDSQRRKLTKKDEAAGLTASDMPYLPADEQPGMAAMLGIAEQLAIMGCAVSFVRVPEAGVWPCGYDVADLLDDAAPPVSLQAALSDLRVYPFVDDNASFPAQPLQSDGADGTPDSNIADGGGGGVPPASTEDADDGGVLAWVLANVVRVDGKERFFCIPLAANWTKRELTNRLGKNGYAVLLAHPQFRNWSKVRTDTIKERHDAKIRAQDPIFQLDANRYVLIYGTTDVCDTKEMGYCGTDGRMPAAALRAALGADRYSAWEDNPNRLQVRVNDFGFFPDSPHGMARKDNVALSEEDRKDPEKLRKTLDIDEENFLSCVNIYDGLPFKQKNICELEKVNHYRDLIFGYESCRNILAAIELLCNHDVRITEWVLNWIAYRLRHPAVKQDTALVFASPVQGAGKSLIFATLLPKIFGRWAGVLGQSDMESQFSGVYENKLYIVYEEVNSPRKRFDLMGRLKNEITGEFIRIEKKGMDTVYQRNYIGFVYLSNYHSPVVPEQNDRRFCIVSPQHKMDEQFAAAVAAEIYDDNAVQDFVDFLYALPLLYTDDFGRRKTYHAHTHAPETDAKKAMKKWNAHPYEVYADDWQSGELGLPYIPCKLDDCFKVFNVWCVMVKEKGMSKERFKMALNHLNGIRVIRTAVEGSQKQVWLVVPPNIKKPDNMPMPRFYLHSADKFARAMSKQSWL